MKKIILFTDSLGAGGAQRQLVGLAKLLKETGENVTILTYHKNEFYLPFLQEVGVKYYLLNKTQGALERILKVCKYIRKEKPDVLISYQEVPSLIACIAKIFNPKVKLIVSERNTTQVITKNEKIRFFLYRWADTIVPNSYSQEMFIKKHYPNLSSKVKTITNFVDLEKFSPIKQKKRNTKPTIMIAATIFESKNTLGFIDALKNLKDLNFTVKWYGYIEAYKKYYDQCISDIEKNKITEFIQLIPKTQNIKECYDKVDYFCLPSFFEGTPNVICEAISCGLPVICSDVCDNSIYVKEGKNGFLFDPKSPESIATAIKRIIALDEMQYAEFSTHSRKIAEEKLSKEAFLKKYQDIIKNI